MFADDIVICCESWKNVDGGLDRHKWNGEIAGSWDKEGDKSQAFRVKCPGPLRVLEKQDGTGWEKCQLCSVINVTATGIENG